MKKLLIVLITIVCAFSTFAGCKGGGNSKEIQISGKEIYFGTLRHYITTRQETYLEEDKANATDQHWFDIDLEMQMEAIQKNDEEVVVKSTMEYEMYGKMGIDYPPVYISSGVVKVLYDLKIDIEIENEVYDHQGEKTLQAVKMKGEMICVDNVAYADLEVTIKTDDEEVSQEAKVKGDFEDILNIDIDEISDLLGSTNVYEGRLYGISASEVLDSLAGNAGVHTYLDEDNNTFYIDYRQTKETGNYKTDNHMQYEIEFVENSAVVSHEKLSVKSNEYNCYTQNWTFFEEEMNTEMFVSVKKINSATINVPKDADSYQQA